MNSLQYVALWRKIVMYRWMNDRYVAHHKKPTNLSQRWEEYEQSVEAMYRCGRDKKYYVRQR